MGEELDSSLEEDSQTQGVVRCLSPTCAGSCRVEMEKRGKLGRKMRPGLNRQHETHVFDPSMQFPRE